MKNVLILLSMLIACGTTISAQTATAPSGSGTSGDPYLIASVNNLYWLSQNSSYWSAYYKQTANISASSISNFTPIGNSTTKFTGTYDGNGRTITGLTMSRTDQYTGLFGYTNGATIKNLGLLSASITGYHYTGILVGKTEGSTSITKCFSRGSVTSTGSSVGGLVGELQSGGTVSNCYTTASVASSCDGANVGGMMGFNYGTVSYCYASSSVTASGGYPAYGGLIGNSTTVATSSYYNSDLCSSGSTYATATDSSSMTSSSTYSGWDFSSTWGISSTANDGFPYLKNFVPVVSTQAVSSITATTATGNGTITDFGGAPPTAYGVCWSTSSSPTLSNSYVTNGAATVTGAFTAPITGLTTRTTYYVRAYATNSAGTTYGSSVSFTTLYTLSASVTSDIIAFSSGITDTIIVTSNTSWTISTSCSWVSLSASSGTGDANIIVTTTSENLTSAARSAVFILSASEAASDTVTITQAKSILSASVTNLTIASPTGKTETITVTSNTSWTATISGSSSWLSVSPGSGTGNGTLIITCSAMSTSIESRTDNIIISTNGTYYITVSVTQTIAVAPVGSGTSGDPYQVANICNLYWLSKNSSGWGKYFIQTADIDASCTAGWDNGKGFSTIGNIYTSFTGTYDGQNHTISGLTIYRPSSTSIGLFGLIGDATVKSINMAGSSITGAYGVGGVVGRVECNNHATIENCHNSGTVNGGTDTYVLANVGGIVGRVDGSIISIINCSNTGAVSGSRNVAGIVGYFVAYYANSVYTLKNCYNTGTVSGSYYVSGICGSLYASDDECYLYFSNCYSTGAVTSTSTSSIHAVAGYERINSTSFYSYLYYNEEIDAPDPIATGYGTEYMQSDSFVALLNAHREDNFRWVGTSGYPTFGDTLIYHLNGGTNNPDSPDTYAYNTELTLQDPTRTYYTFGGWYRDSTLSGTAVTAISTNDTGAIDLYAKWSLTTGWFGFGTASDPFRVSTLNDLRLLSQSSAYWDSCFIQTADIDADSTSSWNDGVGFAPIGSSTKIFTGSYHGGGHRITNLFINRSSTNYVGLFGFCGGTIDSLGLTNCSIKGALSTGGLAGYYQNDTIRFCYASGSVTGTRQIGGIVGYLESGGLTNCYARDSVTATSSKVGGLAGYCESGTIQNCYAANVITGSNMAGGCVGENYGTISNCFWDTEVSGKTSGCGYDEGTVSVTGLVTSLMQTQSTFTDAGWDFTDIWGISSTLNDGYPYLQWTVEEDNSLAVELTGFIAVPGSGGVRLTWRTESETENLGFIIQRKTVGANHDSPSEWSQIASYTIDESLQGHGSTSEAHAYTWTDAAIAANTTYAYRLGDVDYSGKCTWHNAVEVEVGEYATLPTEFGLQRAYPNPFNPTTTIRFDLPNTESVTLKVFDLLGREVATLVNETKAAGSYSVTFDASGLSSGVYLYRLQAGRFTSVKKLILVR